MDVKKELKESHDALVLIPSMSYNEVISDVLKQLSRKKICYVTLNKTADSLKEIFKSKGINTKYAFFVDAISQTIKKMPNETYDCLFVSSPGSLTELSIAIDHLLKHGFDYLIFDSLTNLLIYSKKAPVAKFVSSLINKIKATETKAIFYALKMDQHQEMIQETSMFVDKVIDLEKK